MASLIYSAGNFGGESSVGKNKWRIVPPRFAIFPRPGHVGEAGVSRFEVAKYLLENEPVISGHIIIEINDSQCTCLAFEMDTRWHAVWLSQTRFIDSPSDICFSAASFTSFSNGCVITNGHLLTVVIRCSASSCSVCCCSPASAFSKGTSLVPRPSVNKPDFFVISSYTLRDEIS